MKKCNIFLCNLWNQYIYFSSMSCLFCLLKLCVLYVWQYRKNKSSFLDSMYLIKPWLAMAYKFILFFKSTLNRGILMYTIGFPSGSVSKESACNAGDLGSISGSGRSPGEGNGNPLQYPCLGNPMDRGTWRTTVHGSHKSQT